MIPFQKDFLIRELKRSYAAALRLSVQSLAQEINDIGFQCLGCGQCCQGDDNSVVVFPFEIRRIRAKTDLDWLQIARPPKDGEWDSNGDFHTLEWRLKKIGSGCRFYQKGKCAIYSFRPLLCRTYPFYLVDGELCCSECSGLGRKMEMDRAREIAGQLILRHITEIKEAIALTERYEDFQRGNCQEDGSYVVHDSEGEHRFPRFTAPRSSPHPRSCQ